MVDFKDGELSFKASALIGEQEKNIWVRAGTPKSIEFGWKRGRTLEEMLLNGLTSVRSESGERTEPQKSPVAEVITPDVMAAFAADSEALRDLRIGQLSKV